MAVVMYADGACRGNPGRASTGVIILEKESVDLQRFKEGALPALYANGVAIGVSTNNVAEYRSLMDGLRQLRSLGLQEARVLMDSQLVIRQMTGEYKVKHPNLKPLYEEAQRLASGLTLEFCHISRDKNVLADYLANKALDEEASRV